MLKRKKEEEPSGGGNAPWLSTFADLMNLLLCFFVLLFAMSTIDAEKFEQISISLANTFSFFDSGGSAIGKGQLISSGMTQLSNLDEFISNVGEDNRNTEIETPGEYDPNVPDKSNTDMGSALDQLKYEMARLSEEMFDEISDMTEQYNVSDFVELNIDPEFRFVKITLTGSILFDSGRAEIKEQAKPILSRVGDILVIYKDHSIEIEGHTDNIPIGNSAFKNNNWLSSARALNAAEYLIQQKGLNPARIKYSGRGEYDPIASNASADGRAKNRRIEIKIYNELSGR